MATILHLDDDPAVARVFEKSLERAGHRPIAARDAAAALAVLARGDIDLVISDYKMPSISGFEFLELLRQEGYTQPVIMLTGHGSIEDAVASMKAGAIDYLLKPISAPDLERAVSKALELTGLRRENEVLRRQLTELRTDRRVLGESPAIRTILATLATVAPTRASVLLQGESGTGKELLAATVHELSERGDKPFVKLNCAALPEGLIESALFGHEKGAFTGAVRRVEGAFERADGGTLLLDEISELRLDLQAKLLRVLQEQEFERVGGTAPIKVDVRIVATTNRDLEREVAAGSFRQDLFYRLSGMPIVIPPLRERVDDIPLLAARFAKRTASELGKEFRGFAADTIELLQRHQWPGNVRELEHVVERAMILSSGATLGPDVFPTLRRGTGAQPKRSAVTAESPGVVVLDSFDLKTAEERLIEAALSASENNRTHAARLLGVSIRTLWNKLNPSGPSSGRQKRVRRGPSRLSGA